MTSHSPSADAAMRRRRPTLLLAALLALGLRQAAPAQNALPADMMRLPGKTSPLAAHAHLLGRMNAAAPVALALALPPRDPQGEADLLRRLYDPQDPLYHQFLTPEQFTARFGPTKGDYAAAAEYAQAHGLTITGTHPNRLLLDVAGPAQAVEAAFGVRLHQYQTADGRRFHAPDAAPAIPAFLATRLSGVLGLDTSAVRRPHLRRLEPRAQPRAVPVPPILGSGPGSGPGGGLTPSDVKTAYGLNGVNLDGRGQTLAVFELDGYRSSDIRSYEDGFGLPHIPLEIVPVDINAPLSPGASADEATLDIELVGALAPRADRIIVYECSNTDSGIADAYNEIASEGRAKQISTCWGLAETQTSSTLRVAENAAFQEMAAQGQTIFSASGDNGAYDDGATPPAPPTVDDPASQPYVTGVGGTTLSTHGVSGTWAGETTWNNDATDAGGGGISSVWTSADAPYQQGVVSVASQGSTTMRNVPDVSLDSDPNVGYAIYYAGGWVVYGGTSTATPLWAGFTALVNQQRLLSGLDALGFANPPLYAIGKGSSYGRDFHDIHDNSTNRFYPAVTGYDDATGWGSFRGADLLADLSGATLPAPLTAPFTLPAGLSLFSLPDTYTGASLNSLFGGTGTYYIWSPTTGQYTMPTAPLAQPGQGYWVRLPQSVTVTQTGQSVTDTLPRTVSLSPGWNQVGDPFASQVAVANLQVIAGGQLYSFEQASGSTGLVSGVLYFYDNAAGQYGTVDDTGVLAPGAGYWLYATRALTLKVPPP